MIMCGIFFIVGIFFLIPKFLESGGPIWFGLIWTIGALCLGIFNGYNAFSERGIAIEEIQFDNISKTQKSLSKRMQDLEQLRSQRLISESEYQTKRKEIISKI
jgi:hypothetical protein